MQLNGGLPLAGTPVSRMKAGTATSAGPTFIAGSRHEARCGSDRRFPAFELLPLHFSAFHGFLIYRSVSSRVTF
jgi:hypothetical protein